MGTLPRIQGRALRFGATAIILVGVGLRLVQWLGNASFWLDEANLAENIIHSSMMDLLTDPLRWAQVAPVGFLFLEGVAFRLIGPGEMALRVVPLLASVFTLLLFWPLARRVLDYPGAFVATALMAVNPLLISFGGAAKHYSTDVLVTVVLLWVAVSLLQEDHSRWRRYGMAATAGLLGFLSIPSALVAFPALLALTVHDPGAGFFGKPWWRDKGFPIALWGTLASSAALLEKAKLSRGWGGFMNQYWDGVEGFLPPFLQDPFALLSLLRTNLFRGTVFQPYIGGAVEHGPLVDTRITPVLLLLLAALGAVGLVWNKRARWQPWLILGWGPFLLAIVFSRLGIYPLGHRTSVFLFPLAGLLLGGGVDLLSRVRFFQKPWATVGLVALVLLPSGKVILDRPPVYQTLPVRELLTELSERREPGEPVYAFWYSGGIFGYYGQSLGLENGVSLATSGDLKANLEELARYRGEESLWLVFPHDYGVDREVILCFLKLAGQETGSITMEAPGRTRPVSLHRFDLSDGSRWDAVDPSRFPTDPALYGSGCAGISAVRPRSPG